ncbi:MAG: Hsp20 family protein [Bryobacteraceae bacterium]
MQNVSVQKIHEPETAASSLFEEMNRVAEAIRRRAFDHFLMRGGIFGGDLDDWLRAERELVWTPGAEMTENDNEVTLRVQAPGLEPDNIKITVTPDSILIQAEVSHRHEEAGGKVCFCDFAEKLFRRFNLPEAINMDKISATLDKGILQIVAAKAKAAAESRTVPVEARATAAG